MNLNTIREGLADQPKAEVEVYCTYLSKLHTEIDKQSQKPKNYWMHNNSVSDKMLVDMFNKVAIDKLYIDGEIITLSYKGKLIADYSYQAYRKKLMMIHPESIIDPQVVYSGDKFHFEKNSGKVNYTHEFLDPFNQKDANIVGSYCVVKNKRGEFIEILSKEEAEKMRAVAKTKKVWDSWKSRMYLKSVIKRLCKTFFHESFKNIESIDNQNYDLENVGLSDDEIESLKKKSDFKSMVSEFNKLFKVYEGSDKDSIKKRWTEQYNNDGLNWDFVKPLFNRVKYFDLMKKYDGDDKEQLLLSFESIDEITDEVLANLSNIVG